MQYLTYISSIILMGLAANQLSAQDKGFVNYQLSLLDQKADFFEQVKHIEFIKVEETDASLLSNIMLLTETPEGLIIPDRKSNEIFFFSHTGDFKGKISNYGQGPKEYSGFGNVWIKNNRIEFYNSSKKTIHQYSLEGQFMRTIRLKLDKNMNTGSMFPTAHGYVVNVLDPSPTKKATEQLIFLDDDKKVIQKVKKVSPPHPFPVNLGQRFSQLNESIVYKPVLSDSVFLISKNGLLPLAKFDLKKNWLWNDSRVNNLASAPTAVMKEDDRMFEMLPFIGTEHILLTTFDSFKKKAHWLINRKAGSRQMLDIKKRDKSDFSLDFIKWQNKILLASISSLEFEEFIKRLDESQISFKGNSTFDTLLSSENPILMKIELKPD